MNTDLLHGLSDNHIDTDYPIHRQCVGPWQQLQKKALEQNIKIKIASGYRSHERQRKIWNDKALGLRPVLDHHGRPLDISKLNKKELAFAILRWSALPGASRHHWGTEIDVVQAEISSYQLITSEYEKGGCFAKLGAFLNQEKDLCGFYRPYSEDKGGVAPEPWHLSFSPLSDEFQKQFTCENFIQNIESTDLELKSVILENAQKIFQTFII